MEGRTVIKLVAFDLDGTVGDTIPLCINAFKTAVEPYIEYQLSEKDIIQTFGLDEEGMIKQIITNDDWETALNDFYTIYNEMHTLCPRPFKGIIELINELKSKSITVALITGKGKKSCDITLRQFAMNKCFDKIETGSPVKNRKSEAIKGLLDNYDLHPNEIVYVGDAVSDITECHKAGIRCLSAAWGVTSSMAIQELEKYNQENIFYSIKSLQAFLITGLFSK